MLILDDGDFYLLHDLHPSAPTLAAFGYDLSESGMALYRIQTLHVIVVARPSDRRSQESRRC